MMNLFNHENEKLKSIKGVEKPIDRLNESKEVLVFNKFSEASNDISINNIPLSSVEEPVWEKLKDVNLNEPEFILDKNEKHLKISAGVIIIEPGGRVWIYEPKNHFGGYEHTFPKGRIGDGLTMQQTARKEALEETGLLTEITGFLGDYVRSTTKTRYYIGKRMGGTPLMADGYLEPGEIEEVESVKLVPIKEINKYLNKEVDRKIIIDLLNKINH